MLDVLGVIVAVFTVMLGIGAVTGRVTATSCCSIADPRRDARMQAAFAEGQDMPDLPRSLNSNESRATEDRNYATRHD